MRNCECVVLWLGHEEDSGIRVVDVYRPIQEVASHRFRIPPEGMRALRERQHTERVLVAAQVHTHPEDAFHSRADDEWAIIRHEGALSLVIPDFAARTTGLRFLHDTKVYRLSAHNEWLEVRPTEVWQYLMIEEHP
jgi:Prokaryotic homologs of the JAB domain